MSFRLPGLAGLPASIVTKSSKISDTDADKTMRVAMESRGVRFNGNVAYVRSSSGSLRNLDLAPGDGCWHTVRQHEAQLAYDNHSSIVSITLSDLGEDSDDIGVPGNDIKQCSIAVENQITYGDPTVYSSSISGRSNGISRSLNSSITQQDVADESGECSMQASRRAFKSRIRSTESASDLAKYVRYRTVV
jgi:hypothetical protein